MSAAASRRRGLPARVLGWALLLGACCLLRSATGQVLRDAPTLLAEAEQLIRETPGLFRAGRYQEALAHARRALEIRESVLGPEHLDTATSLNQVGVILYVLGKHQEARPLLERCLAVRRKHLSAGDPALAETLTNLGGALVHVGEVKQGRAALEDAVEIFGGNFGRAHATTLHAIAQLGLAMKEDGDLRGAKTLQEDVLPLAEVLQADAEIFTLLNNLGGLSLDLGDLAESRMYFERALRHCEAKFGPEHPWTAQTLNNLGGALREAGDLRGAGERFERSLVIRETIFPKVHPEIANGLLNVGGILLSLGNGERARPYFERSLAIQREIYGWHPATVPSLNLLAQALLQLRDPAGATSLLEEALAILDEMTEGNDLPTSVVLASLAAVLMEKGELERAQGLQQRALRIREATLGLHHPATASSLNNLGVLQLIQGDRKVARPLLERALAIQEEKLGPQHPDTLWSLRNLAGILQLDGEIDHAIDLKERALEGEERSLLALLSIGSEEDKALALGVVNGAVHSAISLHTQAAPTSPRALRLAVTSVLQRKGRVLDATVEGLRYARRSQDSRDLELLEKLKTQRELWAFLLLRPPQGVTPEDRYRRLAELEKGYRTVTAELAARNPAYRQEDGSLSVDAVQGCLARKSALIEFFVYYPWKPATAPDVTWWDEPRYVAYVLHHEGLPRWADLGPAPLIERAVEAFRRSVAGLGPDVLQRSRELDAMTMARLRPLLDDATDLILSPDGSLQLVPFAALVDEAGRYLVERYSLRYVTSGRDLLRFAAVPAGGEAGLLLGDADFEATPATREGEGEGRRSSEMGALGVGRLAATGDEVRAIGALLRLPAGRVLTGKAASERAVKGVRGPEILHIASHGFFLPDQADATAPAAPGGVQRPGPRAEEPLLRSGLALSGYNRHEQSSGGDDGVLTALEVADLDLWGTQLVVLSACETGLGDVRRGQGVFGLRRALTLAGAQAQAISLWQVADEPTKNLMVSWYEQMLSGAPKAEALRQIQLAALAGRPLPRTGKPLRGARPTAASAVSQLAGSRHPYYWAAWILSGDPRPLDLMKDRASQRKGEP